MDKLYEIRLRSGKPVSINYGGKYFYLTSSGISLEPAYLNINEYVINDIVVRATEYSLYAVNNQICNGFITISGGIRIGIAGETVWDGNTLKTIKHFNAINIRLPHEIANCGQRAFEVSNEGERNMLILSPPGLGKTTILRDLTRLLSDKARKNILLVDERNELASMSGAAPQLNVGFNTDIINNCSKEFAFNQGIRSLKPDIIVTDELMGSNDLTAVNYAMSCGVKVVASIHAKNIAELKSKEGMRQAIENRLFDRYIVLSNDNGPGTYREIYDEELRLAE